MQLHKAGRVRRAGHDSWPQHGYSRRLNETRLWAGQPGADTAVRRQRKAPCAKPRPATGMGASIISVVNGVILYVPDELLDGVIVEKM